MKGAVQSFFLPALLFILLMASCTAPQKTGRRQYLLTGNSIRQEKPVVSASELQGFIQQQPNKKILGLFRFNKWVYGIANRGKENGFKRWMNRAIAEKPVYLDTTLGHASCRQMKQYLNNTGYFKAEVKPVFHFKRRTARVRYMVQTGLPWLIEGIRYTIEDPVIRRLVLADTSNSLLKPGRRFDAYIMDDERDRINALLKNKGYYFFSKDYISYIADTLNRTAKVFIELQLDNPGIPDKNNPGEVISLNHHTSQIRNVFVIPDYDPLGTDTAAPDTLVYRNPRLSTDSSGLLCSFVFHDKLWVKPAVLAQSLFVRPNTLFDLEDVNLTYDRLSDLQFFRFINISFRRSDTASLITDSTSGDIDCLIRLSRNPIMSFSAGGETTNSAGDFGLSGHLAYDNRNIFRGSENFSLRLKGSMELQQRFGEIQNENTGLFNTFELGAQANLIIPKFLIPVSQDRFSRYFRPKTTFTAGVNYQERSSYRRYLSELSFGYDWRESRTKRHVFNPLEFSSISIFPDSSFLNYLDSLDDQRLSDQYTDHLITALRYSFIFNNQELNRKKDFMFFRSNIELAGNLLSLGSRVANAGKNETGHYALFGIPFAQYVKVDGDFRYYRVFGLSTLVHRVFAGIGHAYGNSATLPFDRGFYAGGANGMRGWPIRSLGPGGFSDDLNAYKYDRMGDIRLEGNIEFRFPVVSFLNGALFADAGNIWLLRSSEQYPGGLFTWDQFLPQLALDAGLGFRFDFSFFVFRIDGALPLRQPNLAGEERWTDLGRASLSDVMWNFGIGYPF